MKQPIFSSKPIALTAKQLFLLVAPPRGRARTYLAYNWLVALFGRKAGYFSGFLFYWIFWCLLFPLWAVGLQGLRKMFRDVRPRLGRPAWLGLMMLVLPMLLGYSLAFPRLLPKATLLVVVASAAIAVVNGILEEVLWRGVYVTTFPGRLWLGYLYPALGFGIWHYAPQSIFPSFYPGGSTSLVLFAAGLGLMWGWVARQTGSIRWTVISHVLLDFSGLGALLYFS